MPYRSLYHPWYPKRVPADLSEDPTQRWHAALPEQVGYARHRVLLRLMSRKCSRGSPCRPHRRVPRRGVRRGWLVYRSPEKHAKSCTGSVFVLVPEERRSARAGSVGRGAPCLGTRSPGGLRSGVRLPCSLLSRTPATTVYQLYPDAFGPNRPHVCFGILATRALLY